MFAQLRENVCSQNGNSLEELPIINNHLSIINNKGDVFFAFGSVNLGNIYLSNQFNLGNLWLKINQSKITNYAKQTQFPKSQK